MPPAYPTPKSWQFHRPNENDFLPVNGEIQVAMIEGLRVQLLSVGWDHEICFPILAQLNFCNIAKAVIRVGMYPNKILFVRSADRDGSQELLDSAGF
jgi:hypothetical protein